MSIIIPLNQLKEQDYDAFEKHLVIEETTKQLRKKKEKCPWIQIPIHNLIHREDENVYLPFYWGIQYFGEESRRSREHCFENKISFKGSLRTEQQEIFQETISLLNKNKTCVMAIYPGGGKCFAKGTQILLYDGTFICVENIKPQMIVVDETDKPRTVIQICQGQEMMYLISHSHHSFLDYQVNQSHILTLWDIRHTQLIDISLENYLRLSDKTHLKGVYKDYNQKYFRLVEKRSHYFKEGIYKNNKYYLKSSESMFNVYIRDLLLCGFEIDSQSTFEMIIFKDPHNICSDKKKRVIHFYDIKVLPLKIDHYYGFSLDNNGRLLLDRGILTHNTITSLALSSHIGLRTFIIVNKLVLIQQWMDSIRQCFGEHIRLQHITTKNKIQQGCQFYIMNAINVSKRKITEYEQLNIGFVIVDECHLIMTKIFSSSLHKVCPRYLLGLSATPFRNDGFDILLDLYFGMNKIVRKLYRPHKVYFIETRIKMEPEKDKNQNIIWSSIIDQQVENKSRNEMIISICQQYSDRNILILTKRVKQIDYFVEKLRSLQIHATCMKDNDVSFDKEARILIATFQKVGTGFSHDKLDMLIIACDTEEYFMQYLGRVFRTPYVEPIIIDIIDQNPILRRHFLTRKKIYQESGGTIMPFVNKDSK